MLGGGVVESEPRETTISEDAAAWLDGHIGSWELFGKWDEESALAEAKRVAPTWPQYSYPYFEYSGQIPADRKPGQEVDATRWLNGTMNPDEYFMRARQRARIEAEVMVRRRIEKRTQSRVKKSEDNELEQGLATIREQIKKFGRILIGRWR